MKSLKASKILSLTIVYVILIVCCVCWVLPFVWLFLQSFGASAGDAGRFVPTLETMSFRNYAFLFGIEYPGSTLNAELTSTEWGVTSSGIPMYLAWFLNTFIVATICCIINTLFVLMVAYSMSRFRFKGRTILMKLNLILGMFPGFLSMIIMYLVMKEIFHLDGTYWALVFIYSAGSGMGFFISKGFFDTISRSIDEAAMIDGASRARIFWDIILPLSKPIIVYTILTAFMGPWSDYITSSYIIGTQRENWTVAIGLYQWGNSKTNDTTYLTFYTCYAAGSVLISVPLAALFIATQRYYVAGVTGGAVKG